MSSSEHMGGVVLSLGALSVSAVIFFATQLQQAEGERKLLSGQRALLARKLATLKEASEQVDAAFQERESRIRKVSELESKYAALLTDLIELAKTDVDARLITQKWKMQQQGGVPTGAGSGAQEQGDSASSGKMGGKAR